MRARPITFALLAAVTLPALSPAVARETIVGRWGESRDVCSSGAAIDITAMGLSSEETACTFTDVTRVDDVVTWRGTCFAQGEAPRKETVVATLAAGTLTLHFRGSGAEIPALRRCR